MNRSDRQRFADMEGRVGRLERLAEDLKGLALPEPLRAAGGIIEGVRCSDETDTVALKVDGAALARLITTSKIQDDAITTTNPAISTPEPPASKARVQDFFAGSTITFATDADREAFWSGTSVTANISQPDTAVDDSPTPPHAPKRVVKLREPDVDAPNTAWEGN